MAKIPVFFLMLTLACAVCFGNEPKKLPTINHTSWSIVQTPFRPMNITAVNGALWICGLYEGIAVSHDKGATWLIKHEKKNGNLLLKIEFVNDRFGHAAGTGGMTLTTIDGGETWSSRGAGGAIRDFSFATETDGIAQIGNTVSLTSDSGATWIEVAALKSDPNVRPFAEIESIAAISPTHYAIALHQDQGENIMLSTTDGGKTWVPKHIVNTFAGTLIPHDGEFWAFGIEYLGREKDPSGGYGAPVALHSSDGLKWEHGVRGSNEFDGCNAQGCWLKYGVVERLYGNEASIWSLPQDTPLHEKWAMVDDKVCTLLSGQLKCGTALASEAPQPRPESDGPISIAIESNRPLVEGCLECRFNRIPAPVALAGRPALIKGIHAEFTVGDDGFVRVKSVTGVPDRQTGEAIAAQMNQWIIVPAQGGAPTPATHMELVLMCSPGFGESPSDCIVEIPSALGMH